MKIAFLGSNEKEVQALNMYFLSLYKPKEEDLVGAIKTKCSYEYRYKNGDLVIIRIMQENIRSCRFDRIYYMDTIKEDLVNRIIFPMCFGKEKPIKLDSDLEIKIRE